MSYPFYYCKKCGRIFHTCNREPKCDCCNSKVYPVPEEYKDNDGWLPKEKKKIIIEELVKTSSEFDQEAFDQRDGILKRQHEAAARVDELLSRSAAAPECPTCHSKRIQRISGLERGISILGLGIFSKKINKSYKCKSCGYTW